MYELLKALLRWKDKDLTVMVVDPSEPVAPQEFSLVRGDVKKWAYLVSIIAGACFLAIGALLLMRWAANGDARIRAELDDVTRRLSALSDSVDARDRQLADVRRLMLAHPSESREPAAISMEQSEKTPSVEDRGDLPKAWDSPTRVTSRQIRSSLGEEGLRKTTFPSAYPVRGQLTRTFLPEMGHLGIDIAVKEGLAVRSVGDGRVVTADWTISHGYVVSVLHVDGYLLVYKHLISTHLVSGDVVLEGETVGRAGNAGVLTTGPHLHLEIWKDGLPLDPMLYFVE